MSERKVLNKYYPPDFDPSKIPKSKEPRNKTFCIRLMAPCNMRCTTCGEYIYKGRKFNARKEDVDDMNYLGLRIYRFYIKCTACVSEICFRTDPENTDYVLESGATRNFEALKRAEEQAEREEKAYREELENNPMKLLEERTIASKNELELAESLDELRELNRRTVSVDYESMLKRYEEQRAAAIEAEERADEEFVKSIFSKNGDVKVKRLLEESSTSSSDGEEGSQTTSEGKKQRIDSREEEEGTQRKVTDILAGPAKKPEREKAAWEKSIGYMDNKKIKGGGLGILVKKKTANGPTATGSADAQKMPPPPAAASSSALKTAAISPVVKSPASSAPLTKPLASSASSSGGGGLGLLGAYSDSGSGSE